MPWLLTTQARDSKSRKLKPYNVVDAGARTRRTSSTALIVTA